MEKQMETITKKQASPPRLRFFMAFSGRMEERK
jgi:hypothetical protein